MNDESNLTIHKLRAVIDAITLVVYYGASDAISPGKYFHIQPVLGFPECWIFHPDDFERIRREFPAVRWVPLSDAPVEMPPERHDPVDLPFDTPPPVRYGPRSWGVWKYGEGWRRK